MPLTFNPATNLYYYEPTPEQVKGQLEGDRMRLEIVNRVKARWEAKQAAALNKEIKPHNPKKATKKEMKEMASWGVKYKE